MTTDSAHPAKHRLCARKGCASSVKKRTAKYCSRQCCMIDPERHQRLLEQTRRKSQGSIVTMTRQLTLGMSATVDDAEAPLASLGGSREDVPAGLSRLIAG